jgi:uncharacterized iron-regulated membrane protein
MDMRTVHRLVAIVAVLFGLYAASTGIVVQLMDLGALYAHAPASDPTMQAIRVGHDGPPNFQVISDADYAAAPLPEGFDFDAALARVLKGRHDAIGDAPVSFLELRMAGTKPVGEVASHGLVYGFDAGTGAALGPPVKFVLPPLSTPSLRNTIKDIHRLRVFSQWALIVDALGGILIAVMIATGLMVYLRLWTSRRRSGRANPFWLAGGWWRSLHRAIALVAVLFLSVIALSGIVLSTSSVGVAVNSSLHHGQRPGLTADVSSPLADSELPAMLRTTLTAFHLANPGRPVKAVRLRSFAGMKQGIVIAGGDETTQHVFNAVSGRAASETEAGYPSTDMTYGWQIDQIAKQIHRGDFFGLTGRWIDLLSGLSLLYLATSGAVIYFELWNRRRKAGRRQLVWF